VEGFEEVEGVAGEGGEEFRGEIGGGEVDGGEDGGENGGAAGVEQ
jgi:hypothetical protein